MKNNKHKYGFTLSEVLLSMVIIGIVMAVSINAIKLVKASYTSLAYFAHKNVVDMVSILYAGDIMSAEKKKNTCNPGEYISFGKKCPAEGFYYTVNKVSKDNLMKPMVTHCVKTEEGKGRGKIVNVLKTDGEYYESIVACNQRVTSEENTNMFCNAIAAIANTKGASDCNNLFTSSINSKGEPEIIISSEKVNSPNINLTNGMRIYISQWEQNESISKDYGYRIMALDLNGKKGPNNTSSTNSKTPADIVSFLVLDNGEVYPLGLAADNLKIKNANKDASFVYLNAKVKGYYFMNKGAEERKTIYEECLKQKDSKYKCNFGVMNINHEIERGKYTDSEETKKIQSPNYSYREALCTAEQDKIEFKGYCKGITQNTLCPPSTDAKRFDMCVVETIKPMFRYKFN